MTPAQINGLLQIFVCAVLAALAGIALRKLARRRAAKDRRELSATIARVAREQEHRLEDDWEAGAR